MEFHTVSIFKLSNPTSYRKQNKKQRESFPADAATSWSTLYAIKWLDQQKIWLLGRTLRVEIRLGQYYVWIGWSKFGLRCQVSREKSKHWLKLSYLHACNIEVIWLIDFTKTNYNKSGAIMKADAACSEECVMPACVCHCSGFIFSLSASMQCFFYMQTWIMFL